MSGNIDQPVIVTSNQDDTVGGDTNGDGNATQGDLVNLVGNENGMLNSNLKASIHHATLKGVRVRVSNKTLLVMGNVTMLPSQKNTTWNSPIGLERVSGFRVYPHLTIDGPMEFWHPVELYNSNAEPGISAPIYAEAWSSVPSSDAAVIEGAENIIVHNTSTSPNKFQQEVRVFGNKGGVCTQVLNIHGQVLTEAKNWTYYLDNNEKVQQCQ